MSSQINSSEGISILESRRAPHRLGQIGYGIILVAFAVALINSQLPEPYETIGALLQPLIFVGIGALLYHIGQHLHALHENVIRMAMMESGALSEENVHARRARKGDGFHSDTLDA